MSLKNLKLEDIRTQLHDLFVYYAQFGDRLNTTQLKAHKFHKLLVDSGIEEGLNSMPSIGKPRLPREKVDLLYATVTKTNLSFEDFLKSLLLVAEAYQKLLTTFYESNAMNLRRKPIPTGMGIKGVLIQEVLAAHMLPLH